MIDNKGNFFGLKLVFFFTFVRFDRSSCSDDGPLYIIHHTCRSAPTSLGIANVIFNFFWIYSLLGFDSLSSNAGGRRVVCDQTSFAAPTKNLLLVPTKRRKLSSQPSLSGKYVSTTLSLCWRRMRMSSKPGARTIVCEEKSRERKVVATAPASQGRDKEMKT